MAFDPPSQPSSPSGWSHAATTLRQAFVAYARWLDSISWKRFVVLSILALICAGVLSDLPPFNIRWGEDTVIEVPAVPDVPVSHTRHRPRVPVVVGDQQYDVHIDEQGVHIVRSAGAQASSGAPAASTTPSSGAASSLGASVAGGASGAEGDGEDGDAVDNLPVLSQADKEEVRQAIAEAKEAVRDAARAARSTPHMRHSFRLGDDLPGFTMLLIFVSMTVKIMAKGRFQAEAKAVVATEMAESEALKRQVIEARMAAMQAQVEPHFLFNTLASIDHLIQTDPARASVMQKNLIALLRASMPSMREANAPGTRGVRDLGRELAVIRPYLEILKVRMEERLRTDIRVGDGLLSAEFPPMMLQSLVENAIKHGLEPKAEGGNLTLTAEIVHGKLAVTVADTGLGFGRAATAGTGIGLSNIRERLALLYGNKAALTIAETPGGGTSATITVPYVTSAAAA